MIKNLKKRLKDQRGLTLIELLAVIVILGIIAAIAIPSIGNIIDKAKEDAVKADAIQVINAAKMFKAESGNIPAKVGDVKDFIEGTTTIDAAATFSADADGAIELNGKGEKDNITVTFAKATVKIIDNDDRKKDDDGVAVTKK